MKTDIPLWLWVVIVLETLPMFLGPWAALTLPRFLGGPEAETITFGAYLYSARNLAVGIALLVASYLRSAAMLFALILVRFLTDLCDLPTLLAFDLASNPWRVVAIFLFLYYLPVPFALRYLWSRLRAEAP